jgi:hypothetical protein
MILCACVCLDIESIQHDYVHKLPPSLLNPTQAVSFEEGDALAKEYNIHFYECSAKQDLNVEKTFLTLATDVKDRLIADGGTGTAAGGHRLATGTAPAKKSGGCC